MTHNLYRRMALPFIVLLFFGCMNVIVPFLVFGEEYPPKPANSAAPSAVSKERKPARASSVSRKRYASGKAPDFVYQSAVLTEDETWRGEVRIEREVIISPQATLTIEPGTVIRFRGADEPGLAALIVQGRLVAAGTSHLPILFVSDFEDVQAGDWQGIMLLASEKNNQLEHCRIEGADTGLNASFSRLILRNVRFTSCMTGAVFHDSLVTMTGGGIRDCLTGARLSDSEVDIRQTVFSANRKGIVAVKSSISIDGIAVSGSEVEALSFDESRIRIRNSSFTGNGNGLRLKGCEGSIMWSRIQGNIRHGLHLTMSRIKVNGNEIAGNAGIGLLVDDGRGVAWGNNIADNGGYDLFNAGSEEFAAIGNWWGDMSDTAVGARIYGSHNESVAGKVRFLPMLRKKAAVAPQAP